MVEAVQSLGAAYIMVKPCDVRATVSRLTDICRRVHPPVAVGPDSRAFVSNLLLSLGFATKLKGYGYLREAIVLMAENPNQSITKELYPAVAAVYKKENVRIDSSLVERAIRNAIESAWERRNDELWRQYFAADNGGAMRRPSNGTLITRISDILCREMGK